MMADKTQSTDVQRQRDNVVVKQICPTKMTQEQEKSYRKLKVNEIARAISALYNTGGGTLILRYNNKSLPSGHVKKCMGIVEGKIQEFLGTITLSLDIHMNKVDSSPSQAHGEIKVIVKTSTKSAGMIALKYNIYLPGNEHVTEVSSLEGEKLKALLNENIPVVEPIEANTHQRNFIKGEQVSFSQSSTIQFKYLKDTPVQHVTFADRLLGKSSKFPCYVSAFANFCGGHVYYGIRDDGMIVGETVDETEKQQIKKSIQKVVNKMIWPKKSEPTDENEDKRWDVYFEPVRDSENNNIEDLYVVVVFVAQCRGGVFVEEPECYEIIDNEVQKIHFALWKQRINLPPLMDEGTCSVTAPCDLVYEMLTNLLNNNCNSEELKEASDTAQKKYGSPDDDVKLTCLATFVRFHLRRGEYDRAEDYLEQYKRIQTRCNNQMRFKVMEQYLSSVIKRCKGEYEESYKVLKESLDLETLPIGIISALVYTQIATLENILAMKTNDRKKMHSLINKAEKNYDNASSYLNQSQGYNIRKADYQQKIYINKALLHLGCSLSGDMLDDKEELINVSRAKNYLLKAQQIIHEGYPFCKLRKVQNLLAQACLSYRLSSEDSTQQLQNAVNYSTAAAHLAKTCEFAEMQNYAQRYKNFFEKSRHAKC